MNDATHLEFYMSRRQKTRSTSPSFGQSRKPRRLRKEEMVLQPWFLPARVTRIIRWLVPADYRKRLHDYFDDYGCMRCSRLDVRYKSNGMCQHCLLLVFNRLQQSINRRSKSRLPKWYGRDLMAQAAQARKLLADFSRYGHAVSKRRRMKSVQLSSPIIDTF